MSQLASVVRALDVTKVVWIDDMFAIAPTESIGSNLELAIEIAKRGKLNDLALSGISEEEPDLEAIAERFDADAELTRRARALVSLADEVTKARAILKEMGCAVEERTGIDWQASLAHPQSYDRTLFLLDRNFGNEQISSQDADSILKKTFDELIIRQTTNYCIVLTKEVEADQEKESRVQLLSTILKQTPEDEQVIRFSVVSKSKGGADADSLSRSLREKLAGVVLYSMLKSVVSALDDTVASFGKLLSTQFPDVNKSVLQSSYEEGVSEIEVILRILQQKHRIELGQKLQDPSPDGLPAILKRFRLFQMDAGTTDDEHEIVGELRRINRAEILSEGDIVNGTLVPIVPGDIFVHAEAKKPTSKAVKSWSKEFLPDVQYWMLLGQLCDIVPRKDGTSAVNMGFLAPFTLMGKKEKIDPGQLQSGRMFALSIGEERLKFDFRSVISANLVALRLCSFNKYGMAYLSEADTEDVWSLASLAQAKKKTLELLRKTTVAPWLTSFATGFDGKDEGRKLKIRKSAGKRTFVYPIRRVCRLRDIEANDTLAALERYWRRPAKPHPFA